MIESKPDSLGINDKLNSTILFNESGDKWLSRRKIVGGSKTNLINLAAIRYQWAVDYYRNMMASLYNPQQFTLTRENREYTSLSEIERKSYDRILSSLLALESIIVSNIQYVYPYITASEISACFSTMQYQQTVHCDTYSQIIISAIPENKREGIFEGWRTNEQMRLRNRDINNMLLKFVKDPTLGNFVKNILVTTVIQGVVIPTEITLIYALARHSKVVATANTIKYVNRDMNLHSDFLQALFKAVLEENPSLNNSETKKDLGQTIRDVVNIETDLIHNISEGMIPGLSDVTISRFSQSLSNKIAKNIGMEVLFPGITLSPIPWYESFGEIRK